MRFIHYVVLNDDQHQHQRVTLEDCDPAEQEGIIDRTLLQGKVGPTTARAATPSRARSNLAPANSRCTMRACPSQRCAYASKPRRAWGCGPGFRPMEAAFHKPTWLCLRCLGLRCATTRLALYNRDGSTGGPNMWRSRSSPVRAGKP